MLRCLIFVISSWYVWWYLVLHHVHLMTLRNVIDFSWGIRRIFQILQCISRLFEALILLGYLLR